MHYTRMNNQIMFYDTKQRVLSKQRFEGLKIDNIVLNLKAHTYILLANRVAFELILLNGLN